MTKKTQVNASPLLEKIKKANTTQVLYIALIVLVFTVGYLFAKVQSLENETGQNAVAAQDQTQPQAAAKEPVFAEVDEGNLPPLGNEDAPVTIVEFSDLQCPFCRNFYTDTFEKLKTEYIDTGKVRLTYRHYPLSFHAMAHKSAEAAECANDQGMFWEMHDKIYDEQAEQGQGTINYTDDDLKAWAQEIGLSAGEFNSCLDNGTHEEKVNADFADGNEAGVSGTPTFFINGERLVGAQPFSAFQAVIDSKL